MTIRLLDDSSSGLLFLLHHAVTTRSLGISARSNSRRNQKAPHAAIGTAIARGRAFPAARGGRPEIRSARSEIQDIRSAICPLWILGSSAAPPIEVQMSVLPLRPRLARASDLKSTTIQESGDESREYNGIYGSGHTVGSSGYLGVGLKVVCSNCATPPRGFTLKTGRLGLFCTTPPFTTRSHRMPGTRSDLDRHGASTWIGAQRRSSPQRRRLRVVEDFEKTAESLRPAQWECRHLRGCGTTSSIVEKISPESLSPRSNRSAGARAPRRARRWLLLAVSEMSPPLRPSEFEHPVTGRVAVFPTAS